MIRSYLIRNFITEHSNHLENLFTERKKNTRTGITLLNKYANNTYYKMRNSLFQLQLNCLPADYLIIQINTLHENDHQMGEPPGF